MLLSSRLYHDAIRRYAESRWRARQLKSVVSHAPIGLGLGATSVFPRRLHTGGCDPSGSGRHSPRMEVRRVGARVPQERTPYPVSVGDVGLTVIGQHPPGQFVESERGELSSLAKVAIGAGLSLIQTAVLR